MPLIPSTPIYSQRCFRSSLDDDAHDHFDHLAGINGWTFANSMYFSMVSMTTIGYSDSDLLPNTIAFKLLISCSCSSAHPLSPRPSQRHNHSC